MTRQAQHILATTASLCFVAASCGGNPVLAAFLPPLSSATEPRARMGLDQENDATWTGAWTNLVNDARQTFTPSLPRLVAVEVRLVLANPEEPDDALTMTLLDSTGQLLNASSKSVAADDCDRVLFIFPQGGVDVSPGQEYSIRLSGGPTFGWKYVEGGYENGTALFNGRPLLPSARSTFLFRTFGASEADISRGITPQVLSLNRANDGQHLAARVGERIEVTLQTIGPGEYGTPQISSAAVRFESISWPRAQNPGGPTQIFLFDAATEGKAQIQISHTGSNATFTATIQVTKR